ncbi:hypothetical protein [Streptomyces sp. NPDC127092]|uniref:hypothetical protein n=1 Tax=Streptomyces sp. NPDC127092 TaxID=3347135 RepID=UPI00365C2716
MPKATDLLAWVLLEAWDGTACDHAAGAIRRALSNETLMASRQETTNVFVMSIPAQVDEILGVPIRRSGRATDQQ